MIRPTAQSNNSRKTRMVIQWLSRMVIQLCTTTTRAWVHGTHPNLTTKIPRETGYLCCYIILYRPLGPNSLLETPIGRCVQHIKGGANWSVNAHSYPLPPDIMRSSATALIFNCLDIQLSDGAGAGSAYLAQTIPCISNSYSCQPSSL